jgi:hypothetical protein
MQYSGIIPSPTVKLYGSWHPTGFPGQISLVLKTQVNYLNIGFVLSNSSQALEVLLAGTDSLWCLVMQLRTYFTLRRDLQSI